MGYRAPGAAAKAPSRHLGLFLFSDDAATPRCKDDIIIDDDIECMYNATCRVAMFKALREETLFQQCVPERVLGLLRFAIQRSTSTARMESSLCHAGHSTCSSVT